MTDYIKNKIEAQRKIQDQINIERNREYVDKMTKEQKTSVNIELDLELLKKIDQEAAQELRTRKAQVLYIIREYFNRNKFGVEKKKFIWDDLKFKKPSENIWENVEIVGDNNKNEPEEK